MRSLVLVLFASLVALTGAAHVCAQGDPPAPASTARADWLRLGRAAIAAQRFDEASSDLANASNAPDDDTDARTLACAWADLGDAFVLHGASDRAIAAYGAALLLEPASARNHVARGWAFDQSHDATRARDEVAFARRLAPGDPDAAALERHLDEAASLRLALFAAGGTALAIGAIGAVTAAVIGSLTREVSAADSTPYDASIAAGVVLALLGLATVLVGDGLHVGAHALPGRGAEARVRWLPGALGVVF